MCDLSSIMNDSLAKTIHFRKSYKDIVDDILAQITKGVAKEKHVYERIKVKYRLEFSPVKKITRVEGLIKGERRSFDEGADYRLSDNMLEWVGENRPDEKTEFHVSYIFSEPSGLTDVNTGSVLRTIVEAISRELDFVYAQIDQVYKSGFIDTANGNALDLVAAILGIQRKVSTRAMGHVTFWRDSDPPEIVVTGEPILFDGRELYQLKQAPLKRIIAVNGIVNGKNYPFKPDFDYTAELEINSIRWLTGGTRPDEKTAFSVDYGVHQNVIVPVGTRVSTDPAQPGGAIFFEIIKEAVLKKMPNGRWEADAQVRSLTPGRQGNVVSSSITFMSKPPDLVEKVINRSNLEGGTDYEDDASLRERAKKALEVAGKATMESLRFGLEGVEGIETILIQDIPDGVPGIIRVVVDGGDEKEIAEVIEDTRAAGIKVEFSRPHIVYVDINLTIVLKKDVKDADEKKSEVEKQIRDLLSSYKIGDDLIFNQILSNVLAISGIRDVKELTITVYREGGKVTTTSKENIVINEDERISARAVTVGVGE